MQVPAPFEYERATSVDQAIGLLERLGGTVRVEGAPSGTVFRLSLQRPRQIAAPASAPVDAPPVA